ncbi:UDP-N-acetylmuramate dehydrogenase [Devosia sp. CAU 1758]
MTDLSAALIPDFDLSARNTLALRARSRFGLLVDDAAILTDLFETAARRGLPVRILGGGSNVVLSEAFDGITALLTLKGRRVLDETAGHALVEAAAGETWHEFVTWTVEQGFGGLENLALIPGTVGAAPVQNIGAYGAELGDFFHALTAYDRTSGQTLVFDRSACAFAYRDSLFKQQPNRFVVLSIRLSLPRRWQPNLGFAGLSKLADMAEITPRLVMDRVIALRTSKLPDWRTHPNAGSFFQNPIVALAEAEPILAEFSTVPNFPQPDGRTKLSAGWLIEKSGLKGLRMGPVGMSERHALVVVNHGGATQGDVAALAGHVKQTVSARFNVHLHEEPIFL